MTHYN